ncbi:MarC family protein [Crocosphaera sp. UHCC 0190]|uniref:MarC family protein n=1 Tax=Crocosphaera sp. UHCC 0190 TaxID=3110246 RepID=UPI002B21456F|nr:MarC family protein [Crocosphaera sp. UHCC 0190]MEA5508323.1 MarC family protein [Crocosphaera sp. UHCC 0190]
MPRLSYVFTIFFLTLGPIKTIPTFYRLTQAATPKFRNQVALQSGIISTAVCIFIAFVGRNTLAKWQISLEALQLSGGLILLLFALKVITMQPQPMGGQKVTADTPLSKTFALALSPLTTPVIITPYGVVAILFYMVVAQGNPALEWKILAFIVLMMGLNYLGIVFADKIMKVIGIPVLLLVGWVFAIMQAALAIEIMLGAFNRLGVIHIPSNP